MRRLPFLPVLVCLLGLIACTPATTPDLVLHGGRIITLDDDERGDATALVIRAGRIVDITDDTSALATVGGLTRVVDLAGAVVIPGLADSHCHLQGLGKALSQIDLNDTPSAAACVELVAEVAGAGTGWIEGRGWDQNDWEDTTYPHRELLDTVTGDRPCLLRRVDGHAAWANSIALANAGIDRDTPDPDGGRILKDEAGEPTGILIDNGVDLVRVIIPAPDQDEVRRRVLLAQEHCLAHGLTAVHDAGVSWEDAQLYEQMTRTGELVLRYYGMLTDEPESLDPGLAAGPRSARDQLFTLRTVKLYADGALGSRGALLLADYTDQPDQRGLAVTPGYHLSDVCRRAGRAGFQVGTHAIGDAANRQVLDIYAEVCGELGLQDHRWRVEHAQILDPADIPRFGELGVIAAMQPVHCTSDMDWAGERLGEERLAGAYAWRSLLDAGAHVCSGTDFPVEKVSALAGLYASRTRTHPDGTPLGGWQPQEKLDGRTALELYTAGSAYAAFMEHELGRIKAGYRADLTVLDGDPVDGAAEDLLTMQVLMTVVDGRVVFEVP